MAENVLSSQQLASGAVNNEVLATDGSVNAWTDPNTLISPDYTVVSGNDVATDVTGAELETLTDTSNADALHTHKHFDTYVTYKITGISLSNGQNDDVNIGTAPVVRVTGPTAAYSITGITGGVDGRRLYILGTVAFNMTLTNEDVASTAANRIITGTGGGVTIVGVGVIHLIYDGVDSRWRVTGHRG